MRALETLVFIKIRIRMNETERILKRFLNENQFQTKDALELHALEPIFLKMPNKELNVSTSFKNMCTDLIRWNFISERNDILKIKGNYYIFLPGSF